MRSPDKTTRIVSTGCHHGMHGHPHKFFFWNISPEGLVFFRFRIHHMKAGIHRIQCCMEFLQLLFFASFMAYIMVKIIIKAKQCLMGLVDFIISVQCKINLPIAGISPTELIGRT